jgi:hypothetical protein
MITANDARQPASSRPSYAAWGIGILVADALLWPALRRLGVTPDAALQGILLFDTFIVVAWYAHLTYRLASTSQQQFALAERTTEAANRPVVVIEWQGLPPPHREAPPGWTYVAKNIGPGLALTVVWIDDLEAERPNIRHIGAIEAGGRIELPQELVQQLNEGPQNPTGRKRHVLLAQPLSGELWTVSRNLIESSGRCSHQIGEIILSPKQLKQVHRVTADEYIHENWTKIQKEIRAMLNDLRGSGEGS